MRDKPADYFRALYAPLLDGGPDAGTTADVHAEPKEVSLATMRARLRQVFADCPDVECLRLQVEGVAVGVVSRERAMEEDGSAGGADASIGDSDRATQAGYSTQYRVIEFRCRFGDSTEARMFYDERDIPSCPNKRHGTMGLKR